MMNSIFKAAEKRAPEEMCGFVLDENGIEKFIEVKNIAENKKSHFKIDPITLVSYQLKSKIKYVVHSHYDSDCKPSQHDIDNCNSVGIPYLIVSYPDKEHYILEPKCQKYTY